MSVKAMAIVWDADLPPNEKLVLLAYADHADHQGRNIYPAMRTVARKTGYKPRNIQYITRKLEEKMLLIPDGSGPNDTNRYRMDYERIAGVQTLQGCKFSTKGVQPVAPEPSIKPPVNEEEQPPNIFKLYEQNIGPMVPTIAQDMDDLAQELPAFWFEEAFKIAAANGARNWAYCKAILLKWKAKGYGYDDRPKKGKGNGNTKGFIKPTETTDEERDLELARQLLRSGRA